MKKCCTCHLDKELTEFNKNKGRKDGLNNICKECSRLRSRQYYSENREHHKKVIKKMKTKLVKKSKDYVLNFKLNGCYVCTENEPICIDCHHLNEDNKEYAISILTGHAAFQKLKKELEKCIPLCSNCHRKYHAGLFSLLLKSE